VVSSKPFSFYFKIEVVNYVPIYLKERLLALVRGLFTVSSKDLSTLKRDY
jgi:hypothetical protein